MEKRKPTPKYVVNIGADRLFFDANRQPVERNLDADISDPQVTLPIWPVDQESAMGSAWDSALGHYSHAERKVAKVRLLGTETSE